MKRIEALQRIAEYQVDSYAEPLGNLIEEITAAGYDYHSLLKDPEFTEHHIAAVYGRHADPGRLNEVLDRLYAEAVGDPTDGIPPSPQHMKQYLDFLKMLRPPEPQTTETTATDLADLPLEELETILKEIIELKEIEASGTQPQTSSET